MKPVGKKQKPRTATKSELIAWLLYHGLFEVGSTPDKLRPTLKGLKFIASRPPGEVYKRIEEAPDDWSVPDYRPDSDIRSED